MQIRPTAFTIGLIYTLLLHYFSFTQNLGLTHIVRKYEYITELTPELMHELIDHIEVHAPDKSSGHRQQKVDIYFRFKVAAASAVISRKDYKNGKQAA